MGTIRQIPPVKYFVGIIASDEETSQIAKQRLIEKYGAVDIVSDPIPFTFTDYYFPEMGSGLIRRFVAFECLMPPELLPDMKILTNDLEEELGENREGDLHRRVNLDPGYVEVGKMILASTKNFKHRVYIRDGIFGEVTLYWSKGAFHFFPEHTFPDYRTDSYRNYFKTVRETYRKQLEEMGIR